MKFLSPVLLFLSLTAWGQQAPPPDTQDSAAASSGPCSSAKRCPADFWLGRWTVTTGGQPAGENRIESLLGEHSKKAE